MRAERVAPLKRRGHAYAPPSALPLTLTQQLLLRRARGGASSGKVRWLGQDRHARHTLSVLTHHMPGGLILQVDVESLERENDRGLDALSEKVSLLKGVRRRALEQRQRLTGGDAPLPSELHACGTSL